MRSKTGSLVALVGAVICLLGLIERRTIFAGSIPGLAIQAAAAALMAWARLTFGIRSFHAAANPTEGGLVTGGPYAFVRHPIYAAVILFAWAAEPSSPSWADTALRAGVTAGMVVRLLAEERLVAVRYPEYAGYAARVKRLVPGVW